MKILIDIGHPAHVHYFRNFAKIMQERGHEVLFTARERGCIVDLLQYYNLNFITRGEGQSKLFGKLLYLVKAYIIIINAILKYKPDILISQGGIYTSFPAWLFGKYSITASDTEHSKWSHRISSLFTTVFLTPNCFFKKLGNKQIFYNSFMELFYLNPNSYKPDKNIYSYLNITNNVKYVILRFVSWVAHHDIGHSGLDYETKIKLVEKLSKHAKVYISSENKLPSELKKYRIKIPPEKMHDVLSFATLYIGEGATMASECAMLGTPAIYVNSLTAGTLLEQEEYGLIYGFRNSKGVLEKALQLLKTPNIKQVHQKRREKLLADKIDVTDFMVWFVEKFPDSVSILKEKTKFQYKFK